MKKKLFVVKKCTPSANGGFILTIAHAVGTKKVFGVDVAIEERYCMKVETEVVEGAEQELNESDYTTTQYEGGGLPYLRLVA